MSYLVEKRYLDRRTDRIKLNVLWQDADPLPMITFYKTFKRKNNLFHIVIFKAYKQENGKYYFKTIFNIDDNLGKVKKLWI